MFKDIYWVGGKGSQKEDNTENTVISSPVGARKDDNNVVDSVNNTIYFYSEVLRQKNLLLNKTLRNLETNLINQTNLLRSENPSAIHLHINSYGGSVFAGLSSVDVILNSKVPVYSYVEGCAASAATLMSVVAEKRFMHRNSFMLIHQLSGGMWGKFEEMKDSLENSTLLMDVLKKIYLEHTNIPKRKLNEILKRDLWFDAEECLKYGLVDEIIG